MNSEVKNVNWNLLLDQSGHASNIIANWSSGDITTKEAVQSFSHTKYAGEFRNLVRKSGTMYGRRLARKALRYRGAVI